MYWYCRPAVRSGWVGGEVTDQKGGPKKRGGSGPPDPTSGHAFELNQ